MNYLQLCQEVAKDSGTVNVIPSPTSVTDASLPPRLVRILGWVNEAWEAIQNKRNAWMWMRRELPNVLPLTCVTTAGSARYTNASWSVTTLARWITDNAEEGFFPFSLYDPLIGAADETEIREVPWEYYRRTFTRGEQVWGRPRYYAVSPANEICFGPIPDKTYAVRGEFYKKPQVLVANADIPELPEQFHKLIKWGALDLLEQFDEAPRTALSKYNAMMDDLERDQLPRLEMNFATLA